MCLSLIIMSALGRELGSTAAADAAIIAAVWKLWITFPQAPNGATVSYIEGLAQDWGSAPYTQGVYSFPMQDTSLPSTNNKRRDLKSARCKPAHFFVGEATHETHPTTVGGALHKGERAVVAVHGVNGQPGKPPNQ